MAWTVWSTLGVATHGKIEKVEAENIGTTDGSIGGRYPHQMPGCGKHLPAGTWHLKEAHAEAAAQDAIDEAIRNHERAIERLRDLKPRFVDDWPPETIFPHRNDPVE